MAGTLFENNLSPYLTVVEQGSTPANPAAGNQKLFVKTADHLLYFVNSSGTVTAVGSGMANPMTTKGDVILGDTGGTPTRLGAGTSGYVLTSNGAAAFPSWQASSGGGGTWRAPVQDKAVGGGGGTNTNALGVTLSSTPTNGNHLIACIDQDGAGSVSSISQTNVTWTLVKAAGGSAPLCEIWIGAVAASASTSLTINFSATSYSGCHISEWSGLTGTLDQFALYNARAGDASAPYTPLITPTSSSALVIACCTTINNANKYRFMYPCYRFPDLLANGSTIAAGYAFPGQVAIGANPNVGNSQTYSAVIVSLT